MRVACTSTDQGNVYRFYKTDLEIAVVLKLLVPLLLASGIGMFIGREDGHPGLLLRLGPADGDPERTLLGLIGPRMASESTVRPG